MGASSGAATFCRSEHLISLLIIVCPLVLFLLDIVLSVLFRITSSDYPFHIFKLSFSFFLLYPTPLEGYNVLPLSVSPSFHLSVRPSVCPKIFLWHFSQHILYTMYYIVTQSVYILHCYSVSLYTTLLLSQFIYYILTQTVYILHCDSVCLYTTL